MLLFRLLMLYSNQNMKKFVEPLVIYLLCGKHKVIPLIVHDLIVALILAVAVEGGLEGLEPPNFQTRGAEPLQYFRIMMS